MLPLNILFRKQYRKLFHIHDDTSSHIHAGNLLKPRHTKAEVTPKKITGISTSRLPEQILGIATRYHLKKSYLPKQLRYRNKGIKRQMNKGIMAQ